MNPEESMVKPSDKRFLLIAVLIFGVLGAVAGLRWLTSGSIVIREERTPISIGGEHSRPVPHDNARVAGKISADHALYYPLCVAWIGLGASMVGLAALAFLTGRILLLKLSSYSCLAFLLLGFGTVAVALLSGQ